MVMLGGGAAELSNLNQGGRPARFRGMPRCPSLFRYSNEAVVLPAGVRKWHTVLSDSSGRGRVVLCSGAVPQFATPPHAYFVTP
jgi:hypothetical protein